MEKMEWKEIKYEEVFNGMQRYYEDKVETDPEKTLRMIDEELDSQYFRLGNDWTGRGIVMDTVITATIEALEVVRASCLEKLTEADEIAFK